MNRHERAFKYTELAMLHLLATGHSPAAVSEKMNQGNYKTADGQPFTEAAVNALNAKIEKESKWSPPCPK